MAKQVYSPTAIAPGWTMASAKASANSAIVSRSSGRDRFDEIRRLLLDGQTQSAAAACRQAMAITPHNPILLHLAALAALQSGNAGRAKALLRRCLKSDPTYGPAHQDLGNVYLRDAHYAKAREAYEDALAYGQRSAVILTNLGVVCLRQGDLDHGEACLKAALRQDASHAEAWSNLAVVRQKAGDRQQALRYFSTALRRQPDNLVAASGLASLYGEIGRHADALKIRRKLATQLAPNDPAVLRAYLHIARRACMWSEIAKTERSIQLLSAEAGLPVWEGEDPFESCLGHANPERNLRAAQARSRDVAARIGQPLKRRSRTATGDRIRIGYLFADAGDGPGGQLTRSMFALHDRSDFEVCMYASHLDEGSQYCQDIKAGCDRFLDCRSWSDRQLAETLIKDEIDVLIDLDGWTKHNRLGTAALRPCDVQITFLGCPASTGAEFMDYIVTDAIVVPPENRAFLSEAPIVMPDCYLVTDGPPPVAAHRPKRSDYGLPDEGIVFCCFSQPHKIEPAMFACWMRILNQVDGSVLWLWDSLGLARDNLRAAAKDHGVAPERLIFAERMAKPDHLRRLELADIALDTGTYNGHTTTADLLWAGVPVVTTTGRHWASRVSTSMLTALEVPQLVAGRETEYEALALRLAREPSFRAATEAQIQSNRTKAALFDTGRFVRRFDAALKAVWARYRSGAVPGTLAFDANGVPFFFDDDALAH